MDRQALLDQWDELWQTGLWAAPLSKAVEDLTPLQAAWKPELPVGEGAARHSVWQILHHMIFWREVALRRAHGGPGPTDEEAASRNFDAPTGPAETTESNWSRSRQQLADTQQQVHAAIADPSTALDRLRHLAAHDSYHLGQIMLLRAMQGLAPIE
jgi:uncharacterized damage-inducible protein DinB